MNNKLSIYALFRDFALLQTSPLQAKLHKDKLLGSKDEKVRKIFN